MTMTMTSSQFGLEDMEALLWGPSFPMADAMDIFSECPDQEDMLKRGGFSLEGGTLPPSPLASSSLSSSSSSSSSPPPLYSPPSSPLALAHGDKAGPESDLLAMPLSGHPDQLRHMVQDDSREDLLSELDWMAERVDLSEFDLDSLIGSCSPTEEPPSSPEDFLASLDCPMELDSLPMSLSAPVLSGLPPSPAFHVSPPASPFTPPPTISSDQTVITVDGHESYVNEQNVPSPPVCVPEPQEELEIKSEPTSPEPASPSFDSPPSPAYTLDLGSEVDVSESEVKPAVAPVIPQVQRLVLSLSPTRIVLVLAPKEDASVSTATTITTSTTTPEVLHASPPQRCCRSRPYPEPKCKGSPPSPSSVKVKPLPTVTAVDDRAPPKPTKAKKLKKMEQNKTAATRYRQKKKSEKEDLLKEYTVLERKNMELTEKADSMAREIAYLKELMEEVRQARINKGHAARP